MRGGKLSGSLLVHFICKLISANRFTVCNDSKGFFHTHSCCCFKVVLLVEKCYLVEQKTWKLVVSGSIFSHGIRHGDRWWWVIGNKQEYLVMSKQGCFRPKFFKKIFQTVIGRSNRYFFWSHHSAQATLWFLTLVWWTWMQLRPHSTTDYFTVLVPNRHFPIKLVILIALFCRKSPVHVVFKCTFTKC